MKKIRKLTCLLVAFCLMFGLSTSALATTIPNAGAASSLPHGGAEHFQTVSSEKSDDPLGIFVPVYEHDYTRGSLKSGAWRNGASGGSNVSSANLSLNYTSDEIYNISFTASVSGSYDFGAAIGAELGVELGKSEVHSLGSGYSVTVPKGARYLIKYRPQYYTYTVVETKYMQRYNPGLPGGIERYAVGTKTCYVDVFSHWDFTHVAV